MIFLLCTGTSELIIYISDIQRTQKYRAEYVLSIWGSWGGGEGDNGLKGMTNFGAGRICDLPRLLPFRGLSPTTLTTLGMMTTVEIVILSC